MLDLTRLQIFCNFLTGCSWMSMAEENDCKVEQVEALVNKWKLNSLMQLLNTFAIIYIFVLIFEESKSNLKLSSWRIQKVCMDCTTVETDVYKFFKMLVKQFGSDFTCNGVVSRVKFFSRFEPRQATVDEATAEIDKQKYSHDNFGRCFFLRSLWYFRRARVSTLSKKDLVQDLVPLAAPEFSHSQMRKEERVRRGVTADGLKDLKCKYYCVRNTESMLR